MYKGPAGPYVLLAVNILSQIFLQEYLIVAVLKGPAAPYTCTARIFLQ